MTRSDIDAKLVYVALLFFGILENIIFKVTKEIVETEKMKRKEEKGRKKYL